MLIVRIEGGPRVMLCVSVSVCVDQMTLLLSVDQGRQGTTKGGQECPRPCCALGLLAEQAVTCFLNPPALSPIIPHGSGLCV